VIVTGRIGIQGVGIGIDKTRQAVDIAAGRTEE
jgi:hypothetical protein